MLCAWRQCRLAAESSQTHIHNTISCLLERVRGLTTSRPCMTALVDTADVRKLIYYSGSRTQAGDSLLSILHVRIE